MEHRSSVVISSFGASYENDFGRFGKAKVATVTGYGRCASTDQYSNQKMSEDLTGAVDRNNHRVYSLMKGD